MIENDYYIFDAYLVRMNSFFHSDTDTYVLETLTCFCSYISKYAFGFDGYDTKPNYNLLRSIIDS